jgi:hypothetical protein
MTTNLIFNFFTVTTQLLAPGRFYTHISYRDYLLVGTERIVPDDVNQNTEQL